MAGTIDRRQALRGWLRAAFFLLFVAAPPLDLFRLDLTQGHFILFGSPWTLGLDALQASELDPTQTAWTLVWRVFLPVLTLVLVGLWLAWKYGRLYCGWLCPHFSVVELINGLMLRASGKPNLWERKPLPQRRPDGSVRVPKARWWWLVYAAVVAFAFLWAVVLLTYLLPPWEIYSNLYRLSLTRNQALFIGIGTFLLSVEFLFARHLFCRYACAVGLFQSLAWMGNRKALVVDFDSARARDCADCDSACDNACPMRLKPRSLKSRMFTCTQCAECLNACAQVQADNPQGALLHWRSGDRWQASGFGYPRWRRDLLGPR